LTIAIGDATGHGLKAGTMAPVTKGLFNHLAEQADLVATLSQTSRALKRMNLRSLFMAMTLVRLKGNHLQCSVAGYDRSKESLLANAHAAPQAVIDRLLQTGEDWAAGKAADDDMTFVALKMK
jgi:serine phosphatase RsbU (regulator of sigma subunit)